MRQIKKAQRNSVTWQEAQSIKEVKEILYNIVKPLQIQNRQATITF